MCVAIAPSGKTTVYAPAIKHACAVCIAPLRIDSGRLGTLSEDASEPLVFAVLFLLSTACCGSLISSDAGRGGAISTLTAPFQF